MWNIHIEKREESVRTWTYAVELKDGKRTFAYTVEVDKTIERTDGTVSPRSLVQESMFFLLERESPEAILSAFNIKEIGTYFPEYEETIAGRMRQKAP